MFASLGYRCFRRFGVVMFVMTFAVVSTLVPAGASAAPAPPSSLALGAATTSVPPVAGEIVVQPHAPATIATINARYQTATLLQFTDSTAALIQTSVLNGTLAAMAGDKTIEWFEANNTARQPAAKEDSGADPYCGTAAATPSGTTSQEDSGADPYCTRVAPNGATDYTDQWVDYVVNLRWAQRRNFQGQGITIAVVDTQVEMSHPALAGKLLPNLDLVPLDPQTNVPTTGTKRGHGTFVAGVALHIAPGAKVLPVHALNEDGRGSTALVAEGIRQAAKAGAQVINLSLSTPTPARVLQDAVAYAQQKGVVMVAAYGNEGQKQPPVYPANFGNVISVVATDDSDV
jgi:subtilisin family serine protease